MLQRAARPTRLGVGRAAAGPAAPRRRRAAPPTPRAAAPEGDASTSGRPVYDGVYGRWSVEPEDELEVLCYRLGLTATAVALAGGAAVGLAGGDGVAAAALDPLCLLGAGGLGVSVVLIHIYVTPLKRFLQLLWAAGVVGGVYLYTQRCGGQPLPLFLGYLNNPLSWAMEVAALLAIILLDYADFALILGLLLLNAMISFVEESNADQAIKALAGALAPKCKCMRDGTVRTMDAVDIVPGDILVVKFGDIVPADIKILGDAEDEDETPMQIDQAALTGESLPVKKFTGDVAYSGSTCKAGERHCLVYATGINTFFGRAAALISATNNVANIAKVMTKIGAICLVTIGAWIVLQLGMQFGLYHHRCDLGPGMCPTLTNLLVIIVGGIPIAMPTVLSVTLALGASQLAKHGAIVARMSAVEEMAGMDILCSDKTGTLTLNKLSVDNVALFPMNGFDSESLLKYGCLGSNTVTEEAIDVVLANSYGGKDTVWNDYKLVKWAPFNPTDKFTMAVLREGASGRTFRVMKGAPQVVLKRAHNFDKIKGEAEAKIVEFAGRGYRALGVGVAEGEGSADAPGTEWKFCGLLPLFDPPRHDTAETIRRCHEKGIDVKMVTGDQQLIGVETARQLGMGLNIFKIEKLLQAKAGSGLVEGCATVEELVEGADGFAEVFPEHKFEIVEILQRRKHLVGMTGDGVNDAPALKKADVGVAVHGATDAARGAADIVLTEPGLSVIVEAVIGARKIFQRMTTYAKYTVAMTFRVCFTFGLLTVAYNWYFPTILIVLLAVFNDGAMIALSKDRVTPSPAPNSWRLRNIFALGIVFGLYLTASSWVLYHVASRNTFFQDRIGLFSLNIASDELVPFCNQLIAAAGADPAAPASKLYPGFPGAASALEQCLAEQRYVRGAQLRSLLYSQVSISGQALVFVTRCVASSLIAAFGFGGYSKPPVFMEPCLFCAQSNGVMPRFFPSRAVPVAGTEGVFTPSVIGAGEWVVVAWVWSLIWHMGLDPVKWAMSWLLNSNGVRSRSSYSTWLRSRARYLAVKGREISIGGAAATYTNPLGRASLAKPPPAMLARASVISVSPDPTTGLMRVSTVPYSRVPSSAGKNAPPRNMIAAGATPSVASPLPLRRLSVAAPAPREGRRGSVTVRRGSRTAKNADGGEIELPV
ncbi:plasma-membrane proton-efflux P-type ATPase [Raphidocelis subcapitata]|uniref:Plasma membrane ATPase n=1 Tax=Raphidocelis subcapitata TaxID=307507 RepID=A0A2V0P1U7_9CHLO|nr:plasma-membrane proton-efflux P-type ATPase [Raphidocelis subcapitata]|eukprot:GBF93844.1 plasma-membrane proton-efflux P-type ATPase [Raphidocelis subcapitata]